MYGENVGSIEYDARITTSQLKRDAREVDSTVKNLGDTGQDSADRVNSSWLTVGKVGFAAAATAGIALATAVYKAAQASWDQVSAVQASGATLNSYIKDSTKVAEVQKQLISYAKSDLGVLFNRKDLFESASNLARLGVEAGKIPDKVKILSRAVATGQTDWTNLNDAVSDVISTGTLIGPTFDRLSRSGFNLDDSLRNASISSEDLFDALDRGIPASLQQDMNNNIPVAIRLETAFRNVGDALLGVNEIGDGFNIGSLGQGIVKAMQAITDFLRSNEIKAFMRDFGNSIVYSFKVAQTAIQSFITEFQPAIEYIKGNKQLWETLKISLMALGAILLSLSITVGVILVGAFVILGAVIQAAIWITEKMIEFMMLLWNALYAVSERIYIFGTVAINTFTNIWNAVRNVFGNLPGYFSHIWASILHIFSNAGIVVGNAIGNSFRSVINGVIGTAGNIINGFINAINNAIDVVNKIPGVKVGKLGSLPIPQMATGGIVTSPTLAMIGEGGESEAVIPLSKLDKMLERDTTSQSAPSINIELNMSGIMTSSPSDERAIAKRMLERINEELRSKHLPELGVAR